MVCIYEKRHYLCVPQRDHVRSLFRSLRHFLWKCLMGTLCEVLDGISRRMRITLQIGFRSILLSMIRAALPFGFASSLCQDIGCAFCGLFQCRDAMKYPTDGTLVEQKRVALPVTTLSDKTAFLKDSIGNKGILLNEVSYNWRFLVVNIRSIIFTLQCVGEQSYQKKQSNKALWYSQSRILQHGNENRRETVLPSCCHSRHWSVAGKPGGCRATFRSIGTVLSTGIDFSIDSSWIALHSCFWFIYFQASWERKSQVRALLSFRLLS